MTEVSKKAVLATGRAFMQLLDEMEKVYEPQENANKRWVIYHQKLVSTWVERLETAASADQANSLWRDMQTRSRILENAMPDEYGRRYRALKSKLFRQMAEFIAGVRQAGGAELQF
jgi:hypothetical protein